MRLQDKVAIVTGSTKGIGEATAQRFAEEGALVVVTGRSQERGERVAQDIRAKGGRASFIQADLKHEGDVQRVVDFAVAEYGAIHVLVNNAAPVDLLFSGGEKAVYQQSTEDYDAIVKVGQYAVFWGCKYAIPHMITAGGGSIVNITSIAGSQGAPALHAYSATKGAMDATTRQIASDVAQFGIRCNTVMIGTIDNGEQAQHLNRDPVFAESLKTQNLFGRWGHVREAANLILFLASDEASFITAAHIPCDGGQLNKMFVPKFTDLGTSTD